MVDITDALLLLLSWKDYVLRGRAGRNLPRPARRALSCTEEEKEGSAHGGVGVEGEEEREAEA